MINSTIFSRKIKLFVTCILLVTMVDTYSQVGIGTTAPTSQSALDIRTTDKGLLIPRLTTVQRNALGTSLTSSANVNNNGMQVYDTDTKSIWFWTNLAWLQIADTKIVTTSYKPVLDNTIGDSALITAMGRYIVPSSGLSNAFGIQQANKYADYDGTTFTFTSPLPGDKVTIERGSNIGVVYVFNNGVWVKNSQNSPLPTDNYSVSNTYNANDLVIYTSRLYQANSQIPANTAFTIGTTGATWRLVGSSTVTSSIVIGSTGIAQPAKATIIEVDFITLTDDGTGWCQVDMKYSALSAIGAAAGSGTYLFNLPTGYQFDTNYHKLNTQTSDITIAEYSKMLPTSGYMISSSAGSLVMVVPHSATQFKITTAGNLWSATNFALARDNYFQLTSQQLTYAISFRFKKQ